MTISTPIKIPVVFSRACINGGVGCTETAIAHQVAGVCCRVISLEQTLHVHSSNTLQQLNAE
jgi:hypothetical protein